jgi:type II secretory pathway pseudopilin PulG
MFKLNEKGMTLVETMVAAGLLGGLAVAGMTLFKTQTKAQKTVEQNYETTATLGAIRSILADMTNCNKTLGGLAPVVAGPTAITAVTKSLNGVDSLVYTRNSDLAGTTLKITSYALSRSYPGLQADTASGGETMLVIGFSRGRNVQTDAISKTVKINYTKAAGVINNCYAVTSGATDTLWQIEGAGPNIFYASGNVGVGTSTPLTNLHVEGPSATINLANNALNAGTLGIRFTHHQSSYGSLGKTAILSQATGAWSRSNLYFALNSVADGSVASVADSKLTILNSGNVGIGTTAPSTKLHVNDTASAGTTGIFQSNAGYVDLRFMNSTSSSGYLQYIGNNWNFFANSGGTPTMTITGATAPGRVGIGITNPATNLHIHHTGNSPDAIVVGDNNTLTNTTGIYLRSTTEANIIRGSGAALIFRRGGVGGPEDMRIINGNVGIGTTSPAFKLGVAETNGSNLEFAPNYTAGASAVQAYNRTTTAYDRLDFIGAGFLFRVNGTTQMTMDTAGRVGIGTAPVGSNTLTVQGDVNIGGITNTRLRVRHVDGKDTTTAGLDNLYLNYSSGTDVYVGNPGVSAANLRVATDVYATRMHASSYLYTSDRRLKENFESISSPLAKVLKLRGLQFDWKKDGQREIGFIAQDVEKVVPELVETADNDLKSVKYGNITALLVEAFKDLKSLVDDLFSKDKELENEIAALKAKNKDLEKRLLEQERKIDKILQDRIEK